MQQRWTIVDDSGSFVVTSKRQKHEQRPAEIVGRNEMWNKVRGRRIRTSDKEIICRGRRSI